MALDIFLKADTWLALLTLCFLEIVLGIDNIIFISIVSNKLPEEQRRQARNTGLFLAMFVRIGFLLAITWIIGFKQPLFSVSDILPNALIQFLGFHGDHMFSGRDLILGFGGLFLIAKSTMEINHEMEGEGDHEKGGKKSKVPTIAGTIVQIIILDIIFSFDSILTAVGVVDKDKVIIMILAVIVSIGVMMFFSGAISKFIQQHPSMEVLALGFLILIGFMLFLEALEVVVPKGYIYFAVAFSLLIEFFNIRVLKKRKADPVKLHKPFNNEDIAQAVGQAEEPVYSNDPSYPIGKFEGRDSYSDVEVKPLIARIERLPAKIEAAVNDLSDEELDTAYREGGWTLRQVVHHLADSHMNAYIRMKWMLTENNTVIKAYDQNLWAQTPDASFPVTDSINLLYSLHSKWTNLMKEVKPEELEKEFIHPETHKHVSLGKLIATYAWHGDHHLAHINALKKRMGW